MDGRFSQVSVTTIMEELRVASHLATRLKTSSRLPKRPMSVNTPRRRHRSGINANWPKQRPSGVSRIRSPNRKRQGTNSPLSRFQMEEMVIPEIHDVNLRVGRHAYK